MVDEYGYLKYPFSIIVKYPLLYFTWFYFTLLYEILQVNEWKCYTNIILLSVEMIHLSGKSWLENHKNDCRIVDEWVIYTRNIINIAQNIQ